MSAILSQPQCVNLHEERIPAACAISMLKNLDTFLCSQKYVQHNKDQSDRHP